MKDEGKTKKQLINELTELRQRIAELEVSETLRKQAEEALQESEEKYRTTFESTGTATAIIEEDTTLSMVNSQFEKFSGYSKEEIEGKKSWTEFVVKDDLERMKEYHRLRRIAADTAPTNYEFRFIDRYGEVKDIFLTIAMIPGTKKSAASLLDITARKRAEEALVRRAAQLALINDIGGKIAAVLKLDSVLDRAARLVQESFGYHHAALFTLDRERGELVMRARAGAFTDLFHPDHRLKLEQGIVGWVGRHGETLLANDVDAEPRYVNLYPDKIPTRSELSVPMRLDVEVVGVLDVQSPQLNAFDENDVMMMETLADQIAVAIENARLYQAAQRELAERKRMVEALRESEERYRRLVEFSPETIAVHSGGKIIYINAAGVKLLGAASLEELIGLPMMDFVHPDDQEIIKERVRQGYEQGEAAPPIEEKFIRLDRQVIDVETVAVPITYQGKPAMLVVARDITERKRAEEALQRSKGEWESTFNAMSDWVSLIDLKARILRTNRAGEKLVRVPLAEMVGQTCCKFVHGSEKPVPGCPLQKMLHTHQWETAELQVPDADRWLVVTVNPVTDEEGNLVGAVHITRDITKRKQLEAQLRQAQKMESIGQLAAGIAHDFNNLLTPIGGFSALLLGKAPEGTQEHEYLSYIRIAVDRAAALTRQLRLFTRQEEGERYLVQLNSVIEEIRDLLEHSIPKEITIELHLESELWAVEADPSQISQVLMNLCVNACDAMADGGTLTLEMRNVTLDEEYAQTVLEAQPGRYVCLNVSDTGCGMSPEVQARLFEPFFTTKEMGEGTGLGLSVVYGIVKGHGGFINVYSEEGQGSTFHVYLPAIELAVEEREVEELELPTGTETILLVDDEEMVRTLGQHVLELCGYTVLMAEDGVQALEVYQAHREEIALVVLDVIMPEMGGQECLRRLRELTPQVKVLMSTGYTARGLAQELVAGGALGVVERPFRLQDFATVVRTALDES